MDFDITKHTIFLTLTGSRVYGTSTPESDYDYRGVAIPPKRYFFGCSSRFNQAEMPEDDSVVYDIRKFLSLAIDNNPNIIELLYIPTKFWRTSTYYWDDLVGARKLFLSQKAYHTFRGYATSQLKRIQTHRGWLLQGDLKRPERVDFGLAKRPGNDVSGGLAMVVARVESFNVEPALAEVSRHVGKAAAKEIRQDIWRFLEHTLSMSRSDIEDTVWLNTAKSIGMDDNLVDLLQREKAYNSALRNYKSWLRWKVERNPKRRELEAKVGYDAKHAMHLARLLLMCEYILTDHKVVVELPEVDFLIKIRSCNVPYEDLMSWVEIQNTKIDAAKKQSTLRNSPDRKAIEQLGIDLVENYLRDAVKG